MRLTRQLHRTALLAGCAVITLWAPLARAQDTAPSEDDGEAEGQLIIVTGEGLPATPATPAYDTQVIGKEQLVATASGRLEDALASVAGFQQFRRSDSRSSNPSAQGATLRALGGNATSRALVLLDGVPMADPFFGFIPFSALAPERLESVRVTRGGGSGPFGAGALAGTIELESAKPGSARELGGHFYVNDRGETETAAHLSRALGAGYATVAGRWDRGRGFYTTPEADRVAASAPAAYDSWSIESRGLAPIGGDMELQARALIYDDRRTLRFEGADSSSSGQDASVRLVGRGEWAFDALAYVQSRNFTNTVISATRFVPVLDQRNTPSSGIGGKIELRPPLGERHVLRVGADVRRSTGQLYETALSAFTGAVTQRREAGGSNTNFGIFAEDDVTFGALTITGGARLDRYLIRDGFFEARDSAGLLLQRDSFPDRAGWATSFRGGAVLAAAPALDLRAAAYSGLRLPTLNELYRPFVVFPVTTQANAALDVERLEGVEVGLDYEAAQGIALSLTAFDNRVSDAIANVTLDPVTRQRQNIEAIRARGIEASIRVERGPFGLEASLAANDARAQEAGAAFDGKRPAQTPSLAAAARASYRFGRAGLVSASLRHVARQFEDDLESDILPAVTTIDAFAQLPLSRRFFLVMRAENLTDATIVTRNQGGSIDYGTPRTLWLGVKAGL